MAQPRTERKRLYNLPNHLARRQMSSHLSDDLLRKYGRRTVVLRKGDTVKIMRGEYAGTTGKVTGINSSKRKIEIEGVTVDKADKTKVARLIDASNLLITKLDLSDPKRREKLGASEADAEGQAPRPKREREAKKAEAKAAEEEEHDHEHAEGEEPEEAEEEKPKAARGQRRKKGEAPEEEE